MKRSGDFEAVLRSIIQRHEKVTGVAVCCVELKVIKADGEDQIFISLSLVNYCAVLIASWDVLIHNIRYSLDVGCVID